jgi:hypothetical protein
LPERFWLLGNNPVSRIDISQLKQGEKPPNQRQQLVRDIVAFRASDKQRWAVESCCVWIFEWEIAHLVQSSSEGVDWDSEFQRL